MKAQTNLAEVWIHAEFKDGMLTYIDSGMYLPFCWFQVYGHQLLTTSLYSLLCPFQGVSPLISFISVFFHDSLSEGLVLVVIFQTFLSFLMS